MKRTTPIRLALAITELNVGGAERCLVELATRLDPLRFTPVVYCLGPRPYGEQAILTDRLEQAGIRAHYLGGRSALGFARVLWQLLRLLRAQRPELLQTFLFHANVLGAIAARRAGVPKIVTGIRVAERRPWHLWLARWTSHLVDRHVCVSQSVAQFSSAIGRLPAGALVVIPNGVDLDRFAAVQPCSLEQFGVLPGRRVVTYVGRLDWQKGVRWLLDFAPQLLRQLPSHDLLIVGEGPQRPGLEDFCRKLPFAGRVHFGGWRADVPGILAASDLLVLPSRWEGMPNVVLEAMASGKPVVANDVEGVAELLGPAAAAQVVPTGDAQLFCTKVVAILIDPVTGLSLGSENRRRVAQHFSLPAMVAAYQRLYESLVDGEK